jgi:phosphoribosyl 1,2-cyclic phosphodiesterase
VEKHLVRSFQTGKAISIGQLKVTPFRKSHDASDPHSFLVSDKQINIGVFTDIGYPCKQVIRYFQKCHAAFLEANYCADMLENGGYPYYLKKRISSDKGHLSNAQALELFNSYRPQQLSHLILSHLSKNNNRPELVDQLFTQSAGSTKIIVASRYEESSVFCIGGNNGPMPNGLPQIQAQLSLF